MLDALFVNHDYRIPLPRHLPLSSQAMPPSDPPPAIIDVVIPARNEQSNIPALLAAMPRTHLRHIVLADNGSTDQTGALAREHGAQVVYVPQPGYGAACLAGLQWLAGQEPPPDIVAFVDADLADDPALLPELCRPIIQGHAELAIACRRKLAQPGALTPLQHVGNFTACTMIHLFTGRRYRDLGPMRAIRWPSLRQLDMRDRTWGWTVEMQYKAAALRMPVYEMDVPYRRRRSGKSKISGTLIGSAKAGWKIIATILILWWRMRPGHRG